jgi:hypothetical protein
MGGFEEDFAEDACFGILNFVYQLSDECSRGRQRSHGECS